MWKPIEVEKLTGVISPEIWHAIHTDPPPPRPADPGGSEDDGRMSAGQYARLREYYDEQGQDWQDGGGSVVECLDEIDRLRAGIAAWRDQVGDQVGAQVRAGLDAVLAWGPEDD